MRKGLEKSWSELDPDFGCCKLLGECEWMAGVGHNTKRAEELKLQPDSNVVNMQILSSPIYLRILLFLLKYPNFFLRWFNRTFTNFTNWFKCTRVPSDFLPVSLWFITIRRFDEIMITGLCRGKSHCNFVFILSEPLWMRL